MECPCAHSNAVELVVSGCSYTAALPGKGEDRIRGLKVTTLLKHLQRSKELALLPEDTLVKSRKVLSSALGIR